MRVTHLDDEAMMEQALELAAKARVTAPPNPWVGCVIAKNGRVVGKGFTMPPGQAHAEIVALNQAGEQARGATVFVTLEPCSHYGRTPPCVDALINAGVSRIVIGMHDPDSRVSGLGIQRLRESGITVETDVAAPQVAASLASYLYHRRTGKPFCIAKAAVSIDGRIAAADGTSQWITSPEACNASHRLRAESQAILIGARTAIIDRPRLTVRNIDPLPLTPPLRIVVDAVGIVPPEGPLFETDEAPTLIVTTEECPLTIKAGWERTGVEVAIVKKGNGGNGVDLEETMFLLGKRGILQVMVEGGGTLLGAFIRSKQLQALHVYVGSCILGDMGLPLFRAEWITTLSEAPRPTLVEVKTFGETVRLSYAFFT